MFILFIGITLRFMALGVLTFIAGSVLLVRRGKQKTARIDMLIALLLALAAYTWVYVKLPAPNLASVVMLNLMSGLIAGGIQLALFGGVDLSQSIQIKMGRHGKEKKDVTPGAKPLEKVAGSGFFAKVLAWEIALVVIAMVGFSALNIMEAKQVANLAPVVSASSTKEAPLPAISGTRGEVPVVNTPQTVLTQINNSLSNIPNANVYSVDHVRVQIMKNKMTYIAPLDFDGSFFRFLRYKKVDGYFAVDATSKSARPRFVKKAMYYTPQAYFGKDIERMMYAHTASSGYVLMDNAPQLEVDNAGKPYYVATLVKRYGVTSRQDFRKKAVVTVSAETGKTAFYTDLSKKPSWLDVAIDPTTASAQVTSWASDRNGWWNANGYGGSRRGVMVAVDGSGTEGNHDEITPVKFGRKIFYLQALTSARSSQTSVMGYIFTDAASGKSYYYREVEDAMTPDRAQKLAKDMMKQTGWKPKMPMLYRIDGKPTWVVSMLDSSNAFRAYVYLLAAGNGTQDTVATATSANETLEKYRALFGAASASGKVKSVQGVVLRVSRSGDNVNFLLAAKPSVVYNTTVKTDPTAQFLQTGDHITFKARESGSLAAVTGKIKNDNLTVK